MNQLIHHKAFDLSKYLFCTQHFQASEGCEERKYIPTHAQINRDLTEIRH